MAKQAPCTHHYVLQPPHGPQSEGTCKHCGHEAVFNNSQEPSRNPPKDSPKSGWNRQGGYDERKDHRKIRG